MSIGAGYVPGPGRARLHRVDRPAAPSGPRRHRGGRRAGATIPILDRAERPRPRRPRRRPAADRRGRYRVSATRPCGWPSAQPAGGHDRDHRPGPGPDRPGPRLVAAGGHRRRADHGRQRPALEAFAATASRPWPVRSTSPSSTRSRTSTRPTSRRSCPRLAPGPSSSPTTSCGAAGCRARARLDADDDGTAALRAFNRGGPRRPALRGDDPAGRRRAARRDVSRSELAERRSTDPGPSLRDPA